MAYDIIFSNCYNEFLMNNTCLCHNVDDVHISEYFTPLEIVCKKHTYLLSLLITSQKITEHSITMYLLKFCMIHNMKSLIIFLTSKECSHIIKKLINDYIYNTNVKKHFLYGIPDVKNAETYFDIEKILKLDFISIEFINNDDRSICPTFLHFIIKHSPFKLHKHNDNCNCFECCHIYYINKILMVLYETNKLTKKLLSIRDDEGNTILMLCCRQHYYKTIQLILSFDECDTDILSIANNRGMNALMISFHKCYDLNIKCLLLDSHKITRDVLNQKTIDNKTIYDMINLNYYTSFHYLYLRYKLNMIHYFY